MEQVIRCSDFRHTIVPLEDETVHASARILNAQFPDFIFGTKAETLCNLAARIKTATIPELLYFTVGEWQKDAKAICQEIQSYFGSGQIVVRSSSLGEDTEETAMAGMHTSLIDIDPSNISQLTQAIASVTASYEKHNTATYIADNQILVQKMVSNVSMSGVVFTQEMSTGAPYFVTIKQGAQTPSHPETNTAIGRFLCIAMPLKNYIPNDLRPCSMLFAKLSAPPIMSTSTLSLPSTKTYTSTSFNAAKSPRAPTGIVV
jgi:hypothetical protein